jgi:hypothetical protein
LAPTATPSRTATLAATYSSTRTPQPSNTLSPTVSQTFPPMGVNIVVSVFGANGERVALLYQGGISQMGGAPALLGTAVQPGFVGASLLFNGILQSGASQIAWLGLSDSGELVDGGVYTFQVTATDSFGRVSSYSIPINVIQPVGANEINIFNSAGELVYHESFRSLTVSATELQLNETAFSPQQGKLNGSLRSNNGSLASWSWDGRASDGHLVAPGIYTLQLLNAQAGQSSRADLKQVQVLTAPEGLDPAPRLLSLDGVLTLYFDPSVMAAPPVLRLYNLAGELVPGRQALSAGKVSIELPQAASGVYILAMDYQSPAGSREHRVLKACVLR